MPVKNRFTKFRNTFTAAILGIVGLFFCLIFLTVFEVAHRRLNLAIQNFNQSIEAQGVLREIVATITEIEAGQRAYFLTGRKHFLRPLPIAEEKTNRLIARLEEIWQHDPQHLDFLTRLKNHVTQRLTYLGNILKRFRQEFPPVIHSSIHDHFIDHIELEDKHAQPFRREIDLAIGQEASHYQISMAQWKIDALRVRIGVWVLAITNIILLALLYARLLKEQRRKMREVQRSVIRQQELERLIENRTAVLSELSSTLQIEQEREKAKIARDIHDELGSLIISARMDITYVLFKIKEMAPTLAEKLSMAIQNLDTSVDIKRRIIEELRPSVLDTLGIVPALEWQIQQVCKRANLHPVMELASDLPSMPDAIAIGLFRISQEALTNIVKYAKAKQIFISLQLLDNDWVLIIKDDGIGLADGALSNPLSHGLAGMRQRVVSMRGTFAIGSLPGAGTTIEVRVPYTEPFLSSTSDKSNA